MRTSKHIVDSRNLNLRLCCEEELECESSTEVGGGSEFGSSTVVG